VQRSSLLTLLLITACTRESSELPESEVSDMTSGQESIPAEWTVAEDTSETGQITTSSLQLPTARDIEGLLDGAPPRLVLRCLDQRVTAFIDVESADSSGSPQASAEPVLIRMDDAPRCE
jgi:hypothetical protein